MPNFKNSLPADFAALLQSEHVSEATRKALEKKMILPAESDYFGGSQMQTLTAIAARLIPQNANEGPTVNLPAAFNAQLANGVGKGWRYEVLPPDEVLFKEGMKIIEVAAQRAYQKPFSALNEVEQDALLTTFQQGTAENITWPAEVQKRFFEELLAALTGIFYAHPIGRAEMGDLSFADLPDWQAIGLNEVEPPAHRRI